MEDFEILERIRRLVVAVAYRGYSARDAAAEIIDLEGLQGWEYSNSLPDRDRESLAIARIVDAAFEFHSKGDSRGI